MSPALSSLTLRRYDPADEEAVLELIAVDRLPGQPRTTPAMLRQALEGHSSVDAGWWAELNTPVTHVALSGAGRIVGVVSYAERPKDHTGQLLWLHCEERPEVADALIQHAVSALPRPLHAFHFASALSLGLEALPAAHRPGTASALERAGFTGERLWRFMRAGLPGPPLPRLAHVVVGPGEGGKDARRLTAREGARTVAEAVVGVPWEGIGVLWWIGVEPDARGRGLGRAMLGSALDMLSGLGAREVILYVDDDAPPGDERDRTAAVRLYESAGFSEVDRLFSYTLS